jgi:hypothetical protein
MTQAYPLAWPEGWPRTRARKNGQFREGQNNYARGTTAKRISLATAASRVREELEKLGVNFRDDAVISTNLKLNMSGVPCGDQGEPIDRGVAVYWKAKGKPMRVMAIDVYERVADNLAAVAATLEAMRAIDRHGGAQILDRAFTGFTALPPPSATADWWVVLGVYRQASREEIIAAHHRLTSEHHPDRGGSVAKMAEINVARDKGLAERTVR